MWRFLTDFGLPALLLGALCPPLPLLAAERDARTPNSEPKGINPHQETTASFVKRDADAPGEDRSLQTPPLESPMPRNPFALSDSTDSSETFLPASDGRIPPGIRVVAILVVKGREPVAVLSLPASPHFHFVTQGEVIQVEEHDPSGKPKEAAGQSTQVGYPLYLLVKSVTAKQVEIAPRKRPHDARILR